jgi:hypothetical protein
MPAMLAAAPHVGHVSGARFLLGAILGYETRPRVGQALGGLEMISRGWHSGVVFGTLSAAASAGSLYGLAGRRRNTRIGPFENLIRLETSVPGVFACGDVRLSSVKRVASAVGEGSMAIALVLQFLANEGHADGGQP